MPFDVLRAGRLSRRSHRYTSAGPKAEKAVLGLADLLELFLPSREPSRALQGLALVYYLGNIRRIACLEVLNAIRH